MATPESPTVEQHVERGLSFTLRAGEVVAPREVVQVAAAEPLPAERVAALLARVPAPPAAPAAAQDFAKRGGSLPPPRTGATVQQVFPPEAPPAASKPTAPAGPLEVLRWSPEGEVPLAPNVTITFSQPMVELTALAELDAAAVPARVSPAVEGRWRWLGTSTLSFQPKGRLPMATQFAVEVPAGTRSAIGGELRKAVRFSFATPAPKVVAHHPQYGPVRPDTLIFAAFDQAVDPRAVLATVEIEAPARAGGLRLATQDEIAADSAVASLVKSAEPGRFVVMRPERPLPLATSVQVRIGPQTPSREGPRRSEAAAYAAFQTYAPLAVEEARCGWDKVCRPDYPWTIQLNNELDQERFDAKLVRITPALPRAVVEAFGNSISISGRKAANTRYTVELDAALVDIYGQRLGKAWSGAFKVGEGEPRLSASREGLVTLDPAAGPRFSVFSEGHDTLNVTIYQVTTADWSAFLRFQRELAEQREDRKAGKGPGKEVVSQRLEIARGDELTETGIDLSPALRGGVGHAVVVVEGKKVRWGGILRVVAWVQATKLAVDAFADDAGLVGWVTELASGAPAAGVEVELAPRGVKRPTDAQGVARFELDAKAGARLLVARRGDDVAFMPESTTYWGESEGWRAGTPQDEARWFVFDDRGMYRPGETVSLKGWVRRHGAGAAGDLGELRADEVLFKLWDAQGNTLRQGKAELTKLGGFSFELALPDRANLGRAVVELKVARGGFEHHHGFEVQEFRRPEFEVSAKASAGPHFIGGRAAASVSATYYAGGGLMGADVRWLVRTSTTQYRPPNRDEWTFGRWTPWWESWRGEGSADEAQTSVFDGKTDARGVHDLELAFARVEPPLPSSVVAEASVTDVNRQQWSAQATLLVHPSANYVGVKPARAFVQRGEPIVVDVLVTDLDGKAVSGRPVEVSAVRQEWRHQKGRWQRVDADEQRCAVSSSEAPQRCSFQTPEGGQYRVRSVTRDVEGRANLTELTVWVSGEKQPPRREVDKQVVQLIPDKQTYAAGDIAEILVQAPFAPGEALVTLRRNGLLRSERLALTDGSATLRVPIEEAWVPNVNLQVDVVGAVARTDDAGAAMTGAPPVPAYASGSLSLSIPPAARSLAVTASPAQLAVEPGATSEITVEVRDAKGAPAVAAEVALVVVDEAVLALSGYTLGDPLAAMYTQRVGGVRDHYSREHVLLARPADVVRPAGGEPRRSRAMMAPGAPPEADAVGFGGLMREEAKSKKERADKDGGSAPIAVRVDFSALAAFLPALTTDAKGRVVARVKLPDNLTRYRVMAVAAAGPKSFGRGESSLTARLPLMVRPSPPRFLNFGDSFALTVVLQNQTAAEAVVEVAVRADNAELVEGAGRRVRVPANDRVEVRFPAAAVAAGRARFQVAASSGSWADAALVELPVWTPATSEAFATYGVIDEGAVVQPVRAPADVWPQFGGLTISTSSTAVQALTDAVIYLTSYPFECAEQISSRVLAIAALEDVLAAFETEGLPPAAELIASMGRDMERLRRRQNDDGGFGFWRAGSESWPWVSIHVTHALQRAQEKGFEVPAEMRERALRYLRDIDQHVAGWRWREARLTTVAYALYVRERMGDADPRRAKEIVAELGANAMPLEAAGFVLPTLAAAGKAAELLRALENRVTETAGAAHFVSRYDDGAYLLLASDRRGDGVILEGLIRAQPKHDLIPKIVRGLLAHRRAGRWGNTQENAFVLLALDRYFATYEKQTPDFVARAWLGDELAGEAAFAGRTTDTKELTVSMQQLARGGPSSKDVVLAKSGAGRLYFRMGLSYAPRDLRLSPRDEGFHVERTYEAIDAPEDVRRDADGAWRIKAGARVRVRLTMVAPARRYHVALVDPLPAGLEAVNPALAVSGSLPNEPAEEQGDDRRARRWWWGPWFEHQNLRDERVEAFTSLLWDGAHEYTYVARATTPGTFVVPPVKAEEMYAPEVFGRGGTDRVIVE